MTGRQLHNEITTKISQERKARIERIATACAAGLMSCGVTVSDSTAKEAVTMAELIIQEIDEKETK